MNPLHRLTRRLQDDPSLDTPSFSTVRGGEFMASEDDTIIVGARDNLDDFKDRFGLQPVEEPFPDTFQEIEDRSQDNNGFMTVVDVDEPRHKGIRTGDMEERFDGRIGLDTRRLKQTITYCTGEDGFSGEEFRLWTPSTYAPFLLESDRTPVEWLIHCDYGINEFFEWFGVQNCTACGETWDADLLRCPGCGERPPVVRSQIERLQQDHEGVICLIGPSVPPSSLFDTVRERLGRFVGR